jgi:zeta-carotene desaturase
MPNVIIVGAGIAGMSAALRLAERGYKVTIYEQNDFVGGKFRAVEWKDTKAFHEHSYHMFLNWYHNFFEIAETIGVRKEFVPLQRVKFLRAGDFPKMTQLVNFGAPSAIPQNLLSGVLSIPDMFLYMYSVVDLLGRPMTQDRYSDLISVNAFASTRPYATEASVGMYDEYLAKTFAIASYLTSAKSFQTFLEYGTYAPTPLYWALSGDSFTEFLEPLQSKLERMGVKIEKRHRARELKLDREGNVSTVLFDVLDEPGHRFESGRKFNPSLSEYSPREFRTEVLKDPRPSKERELKRVEVDGSLILAVPHIALAELAPANVLMKDPRLGELEKLVSVPMASVHLHLNEKFSRRLKTLQVSLPPEPVVLLDSKYKLSFVNNSALWPRPKDTYLNIVASDSRPLGRYAPPSPYTADNEWKRDSDKLSINSPVTALDHILSEFQRFVPFEKDEIVMERLEIDRNVGRELFINDVGSWKWRPETKTEIDNLFLAGDYVKNSIDVVCLEGAVVSGLEAAEQVRRRHRQGSPVKIMLPKKYPYAAFWPLKVLLAPYAVSAKLWTCCRDFVERRNA